jgi:hypothetical protein
MFTKFPTSIQRTLIILLVSTFLLGACAAYAPSPSADYEAAVAEGPLPPEAPRQSFGEANKYAAGEYTEESVAYDETTERLVIKNANLTLVVEDPSASMNAIGQMAEEMGGFIVNADVYKQELESGLQVPRASIQIRIPAEKLNEALDRIKSESDQDPQSESINSQDVTSEYVDLQSRLKNLEAAEAQLTEIMESANKTEDVLAVYNELVEVRGEIEVIKGQIKYYEQSAAFSAVQVELLADEAVQPLSIGAWQPQGVAKDAVQALINTFKFLANMIIWIIIFLVPVLLVLYLVFFLPLSFLWRAWRKRRAAKKGKDAKPSQVNDNSDPNE